MDMLHGTETFRDSFQKMVDSWTVSIPETIEIMKANIKLDPHFRTFVSWANDNGIPIIVLSSGMTPIIRALLDEFLGDMASNIEIIANGVRLKPPINDYSTAGGWTIQYRDDSDFGHDKSSSIRPYAKIVADTAEGKPRTTLLYAGDGVSDVSAARETDLLFAKAGRDLITYCERESIPFTVFEDWGSILEKTKGILHRGIDVQKHVPEAVR